MKKIIAVILAIVVVLSLGATCFASNDEYTKEYCSSIPLDSGKHPVKVAENDWVLDFNDGIYHATDEHMQAIAWEYDNMCAHCYYNEFFEIKVHGYYEMFGNCITCLEYVPFTNNRENVVFVGFNRNGVATIMYPETVSVYDYYNSLGEALYPYTNLDYDCTGYINLVFARSCVAFTFSEVTK